MINTVLYNYMDEIVDLYKFVVNACITASDHIPTISPSTARVMPGWNDGVFERRGVIMASFLEN